MSSGSSHALRMLPDTRAADYSETGAFGDPTLASADKGRAFLDAMIRELVDGLVALFPDLPGRA